MFKVSISECFEEEEEEELLQGGKMLAKENIYLECLCISHEAEEKLRLCYF